MNSKSLRIVPNGDPLRTPRDVRDQLSLTGTSVTDLAKDLGVERMVVFDLLRGKLKGHRGQAHRAAVLLGLKHGVIAE